MLNNFRSFQEKRMTIFGELVKKYWNNDLKEIDDLYKLALEIKDKFNFNQEDMPFIIDNIRVAMGLDPAGKEELSNELNLVKNLKSISPPVISKISGPCEYCELNEENCNKSCKYDALVYKRSEGPIINQDKCTSCGACVDSCDFGALNEKIEFIPIIDLLKNRDTKVFAVIAPAIAGQFGDDVTLGKLRTAFKLMGFKDMVEVALFADILTIKEAFEFRNLVQTEKDFYLTSCCCPVWYTMTKKVYTSLYDNMAPSVSPMIASGRILKKLYPDSKVVFIAPCTAKKGEIKEKELRGDIDFVINFVELKEIFNVLNIQLSELEGEETDHASLGGRLYARTGGVSFSVKTVVNRLEPTRLIKLKPKKVHGIQDCKKVLQKLAEGENIKENFIEGMACKGGCVGGPRTNIDVEDATKEVNDSGEDSLILTPFDNLNAMKVLKQLGINSIEEIIDNEDMIKLLTRE